MSGRGAGPASDLWSLGVLLYAAVEGWSPFRRTTLESTLAAILAVDPPEPKQAGPLGSLIVRLLVKDPERRPGADEVAAVLEAVAEGWPVPGPSEGSAGAGPQDASGLREFAEDSGTVRLGGAAVPGPAGEPESEPPAEAAPEPMAQPTSTSASDAPFESTAGSASASTSESASDPTSPIPHGKGRFLLRPIPVAALGVLLVGGTWLATSSFLVDTREDPKEMNPVYSSAPLAPAAAPTPSPSVGTWKAHREKDMDAVLFLPAEYKEAAREGSATDQPRLVVHDIGLVQVRLTQWDKAPRPLLDQARHCAGHLEQLQQRREGPVHPHDLQGLRRRPRRHHLRQGGVPTRVMQLIVVTGDDRMYELRVDMPKGTPTEKKGTAVFKGARDRLEIE